MTFLKIRTSELLAEHLSNFVYDGATVDSLLFDGGRLAYPGRKELEYQLGYEEPYTLALEARVIEGMSRQWNSACRFLARLATERVMKDGGYDHTIELLWSAHHAFAYRGEPEDPSTDRLVAALVSIEFYKNLLANDALVMSTIIEASEVLVRGLHSHGLPPTLAGLEELWDGAPPACVGLGLVEL